MPSSRWQHSANRFLCRNQRRRVSRCLLGIDDVTVLLLFMCKVRLSQRRRETFTLSRKKCTTAVLLRDGATQLLRGPIFQYLALERAKIDPDLPTATTITDSRTRTPAPRRAGTPPLDQDVTEMVTSGVMIRPDR